MEQSPPDEPTARSIPASDPSKRKREHMDIVFVLVITFSGEHAPLEVMSRLETRGIASIMGNGVVGPIILTSLLYGRCVEIREVE